MKTTSHFISAHEAVILDAKTIWLFKDTLTKAGIIDQLFLQFNRMLEEKGDEKHYGYKDHVKVDADSKLIVDYAVTPANAHDSKEFEDFFSEQDEAAYADSAYVGKKMPKHVRNEVCEKGYRRITVPFCGKRTQILGLPTPSNT